MFMTTMYLHLFLRADQISKELLASCEIKDSISIALLTLRYATAYRKTPCPIYLAEDGKSLADTLDYHV